MSEGADKRVVVVPGPARATSEAAGVPERRRAARYPFTAEVEATDVRSQTRIVGRTSDLGAGGCYIDTLSPFSVGSLVRLRMKRGQQVFEATATVSYAHVSMGMGLAFSEIRPESRAILQAWIAELSGEQPPRTEARETEPGEAARLFHLQQVLNDLVNLMVRKKILSETEASALLRKLFR